MFFLKTEELASLFSMYIAVFPDLKTNYAFINYKHGITMRHQTQYEKYPNQTFYSFLQINKHLKKASNKFPNISIPTIKKGNDYGYIFFEKRKPTKTDN